MPSTAWENEITHLCLLGNVPRSLAYDLVQHHGLDGLRVYVAATLYQTQPLDTDEAAALVGLTNRGLLLRYLDEYRIAPYAEASPPKSRGGRPSRLILDPLTI